MSAGLSEDMIEAAFGSLKDREDDASLLATFRAPLVFNYCDKEHVEATLRAMLLRLLVDRPANPIEYLVKLCSNWRPKTVLLLGPPASGKRTVAEHIADRLGVPHVSASDLCAGVMMTDCAMSARMKEMTRGGHQVHDDIVEALVTARLREKDCMAKGWILDGWPRTGLQARKMRSMGFQPQILIVLNVRDDIVEDRVAFRVLDPETNTLYHMTTDPPPLGVGGRCVTRPGESTDEILERIKQNHKTVKEAIEAFQNDTGFRLEHVDANVALQELPDLADALSKKIAL